MNLKDLSAEQLFNLAENMVAANPPAIEAVVQDVKEQWGMDIPPDMAEGIMTCGIALFLSTMQHIQAKKGY